MRGLLRFFKEKMNFMNLASVLLLTVGFCEGTVTDLEVLDVRSGKYMYVSCPSELCPASRHVFRCIINGSALQWQPFLNGTGQSFYLFSVNNPVGSNETQGNFFYNLTNNTVPTVTSNAIVEFGTSRSISSDTLRCSDAVDGSNMECSLIQRDKPNGCGPIRIEHNEFDNAKVVNISISWNISQCAVKYQYKLDPPFATVSEDNTTEIFVNFTGIPANGTHYQVTVIPFDFLDTSGPSCEISFFADVDIIVETVIVTEQTGIERSIFIGTLSGYSLVLVILIIIIILIIIVSYFIIKKIKAERT